MRSEARPHSRFMKKSIGDNMFLKEWGFDKGLALVKKAGYDGIELWLGATPWFPLETTDAQVRELRRKVDDTGLMVSNVSNSLDWDRPISSRDPRVREQATRHITRQIETAQILGTDAILVVAGIVTEETPYQEVYPRTVQALQKLAETAARARVKIGCENCCSEQRFLMSPREFKLFLDDVASPWVGLHLDVGNIHDTGFPEQWIEIHGPRITRVHVKDVMRHRGRCGYDGWLIAEMEARYRYAHDQQFHDTAAAMDRFISGRL